MTQRRYDDDEVRAIFDRAVSPTPARGDRSGTHLTTGEGFTLAELQEIGAEAGIPPERIAEAAGALERRGSHAVQKAERSTLPIRVKHTVRLPGTFTEEDWNRLVVDLRDTFGANGKLRVEGAFREWRNGNLFAVVEPDGDGYRLRMGSRKESAQSVMMMGTVFAIMGAVLFLLYATGLKEGAISGAVAMELAGLVSIGAGLIQLPGWSATRMRQMEEVGERARLRAGRTDEG
ncbi:MAG: hypothetical protein R3E98_13685 [Gemmatimonadota bacterium]